MTDFHPADPSAAETTAPDDDAGSSPPYTAAQHGAEAPAPAAGAPSPAGVSDPPAPPVVPPAPAAPSGGT
ncbi:MAG: hypothetical protein M3Q48_18155, partial [Actinomycetota bacterium]|nr:hypothetical protein [Actinomycetota bacterium]